MEFINLFVDSKERNEILIIKVSTDYPGKNLHHSRAKKLWVSEGRRALYMQVEVDIERSPNNSKVERNINNESSESLSMNNLFWRNKDKINEKGQRFMKRL